VEKTEGDRRFAGSGRRHSPTRERVLRLVEAQPGPVTTAAVATAAGLHENTARGHLEQLHADGYVTRERAPAVGRGRPAWIWEATTGSEPRSAYAGLAAALAHTLATTSSDPIGAARTAGLEWGSEIAAGQEGTGTARESVVVAMRDQGFEPTDLSDRVVLRQCPLIEAATAYPQIVCSVHQGLVDGILHARGETGRSTLRPFTAPGECSLHLPSMA